MNKAKRANLGLRTNKASVKLVEQKHIDPRYKLIVYDEPVSTDSGDLRLISLETQEVGLPLFSGRWDHNKNTVDIDLIRNSRTEKGFQGHHTVSDGKGAYHIDIHVPEGHIFTGTIQLLTDLGVLLQDSMQ